jgi:hypothetical protein
MRKQGIRIGISSSVIKKAELKFVRSITVSVLSADVQELK